MKKLAAMLLSLTMCFSLLAVPAQAGFIPDPDGPIIIIGGDPIDPDDGGEDPDEPGISVQSSSKLPDEKDHMPTD